MVIRRRVESEEFWDGGGEERYVSTGEEVNRSDTEVRNGSGTKNRAIVLAGQYEDFDLRWDGLARLKNLV